MSIHATDPELRARLLRNRRGATSLRWLAALLDGGIEVHGQIVVCPGINDGDALDDTLLGILDRFPRLATVGVVPLGVSDYTTEPDMRAHTRCRSRTRCSTPSSPGRRASCARSVGGSCTRPTSTTCSPSVRSRRRATTTASRSTRTASAWRGPFEAEVRAALGGTGVGRAPGRRTGFFAWVDGAPRRGLPRAALLDVVDAAVRFPRARSDASPIAIVTGEYGAQVLEPLVGELADAAGVPVPLVVGRQPVLRRQHRRHRPAHRRRRRRRARATSRRDSATSFPTSCCRTGGSSTARTARRRSRAPVEIVPTDGASLVAALQP